jgi:hypothetical protein
MSTVRANNYYDANGTSNAQLYGVSMRNGGTAWVNRIINGDMRIDQRNAGASVTPTSNNTYTLDRWTAELSVSSKYSVQRNAGSVTPPSGFTNYLGITSLSAFSSAASDYFLLKQPIEGFNTADLAWGTASAQAITLSFWVRSSLTGTFGGGLENSSGNRAYVFSFTINSANTWEYKTVTIAGDTTGTWDTGNTTGINLRFDLGSGSNWKGTAGSWGTNRYFGVPGGVSIVGTNGATFYITGVQLEAGTNASPFERRDYGRELAMCQRYFETYALFNSSLIGNSVSTGAATVVLTWNVTKRAAPTVTLPPAGATTGTVTFLTSSGNYPAAVGSNAAGDTTVDKATINGTGYSGLTGPGASIFWSTGASTITISAEL